MQTKTERMTDFAIKTFDITKSEIKYITSNGYVRLEGPKKGKGKGLNVFESGFVDRITSFTGDYAFLSNFYQYPIYVYGGIEVMTVEHAFQAAKAVLPHEKTQILNASTPGMAKKLGQRCKLREDWEDVKIDIMTKCIERKFDRTALGPRLYVTYDTELVEGNTWGDTFWGVDMTTGEGENNLGKLIMAQRDKINKAKKK